MKKWLSCLLALVLIVSSVSFAVAEENNAFTADEQAYSVYLDLTFVCEETVRYMEEMAELWQASFKINSLSDIDTNWMDDYFMANNDRAIAITGLTLDCGYTLDDFYAGAMFDVFKEVLNQYPNENTNLVWAGLNFLTIADYVKSENEINKHLASAKNGIRDVMALDADYSFLSDLKNYYKEASLMYDYIAAFSDSYNNFSAKLDTFRKAQASYKIDFEFIFDDTFGEYDKVREVWNTSLAVTNVSRERFVERLKAKVDSMKATEEKNSFNIKVGDWVESPQYGKGTVRSVGKDSITVKFVEEEGKLHGFAIPEAFEDGKLELISTQEPIPEPVQIAAAPIEAFFGTWHLTIMELDDTTYYNAAEMGLNMQLTLNEDGTAEFDGEESTWTMEDGTAIINAMQMKLTEDGMLYMEDGGMKMIFSH